MHAEFAVVTESKVQQSQPDLLHKIRNKTLLKNPLVSLIALKQLLQRLSSLLCIS